MHNFSALRGYNYACSEMNLIYIVMTMSWKCKSDGNAQSGLRTWKGGKGGEGEGGGGVGDISLDTVQNLSLCALPYCILVMLLLDCV